MEVYSSSVEDQLIDGLSYKLAPGSSYIQDRKASRFILVVLTSIHPMVGQKL